MKATFVRELNGFTGTAKLYRLSDLVAFGCDGMTTFHVVVSATNAMYSGPETYIFPAGEDGSILDWSELAGSYRGGLNHEQALLNAGWTVG